MKENQTRNNSTDKVVFCFLMGLLLILIIAPVFLKVSPNMVEFSKSDYENETLWKAYNAYSHKSYDQAIYYYSQIKERQPELSAIMNVKIGNAYKEKSEYKNAINYYNQALKNSCKDSLQVYFDVAMIAHHMKNYDMAVKYYKKSSSSEFLISEASFNLGNIHYFVYEDGSSALQYYRNAVEVPSSYHLWKEMLRREMQNYPKRLNPEIYANLEDLSKKRKDDIDFSEYDLKELLRNQWSESQSLVHNYIGVIYASTQQNEIAVDHFKKAISIDPEFEDAKYNLQKVLVVTAKKE